MTPRWANEDALHVDTLALLRWVLPLGALMHHSPNEGRRGWQAQNKLKRLQTVAGWPDIEVIHKGRAIFIELKLPKYRNHKHGGLSDNQLACHELLMLAGCPVTTCYEPEEAEGFLATLMPLRARTAPRAAGRAA